MKKIKYIFLYICISFISIQNINATDFGSRQEAEAMLKKAINVINYDKKYALELFSEGAGGFMFKDLYVFCMSKKGIVIAHPTGVGIDAMANKDSDGNVVGQLVLENAKNNEINTIKYKLTRMSLGEEKEYTKTSLVTKVKGINCGVGYYE